MSLMDRKKMVLVAGAVAVGVAGILLASVSRPNQPRVDVALPASVTVAEVQQRDLPLTVSASGRVEAKASVAVKSRLDGQVAEAIYAEGQAVHRGDLLLRLDPAALEAQLRQAEGVLARDEAQLAKAQSDYQRNLGLVDRGFVSKSSLTQSEADVHVAQASVKADHANLDNAQLQLGYARITAPMDGVAGALLLPVGGAAKANDTTLLVINQVRPIYVSFALPESQLARLKLAAAKGDVAVDASVEGIDQPVHGKLAFIDNSVDVASGSITAKAIFDNGDGLLTPGQFARMTVKLDELRGALVVPTAAVESGVDGPYAFVVTADSTVAVRRLELGAESAGYRAVQQGLAAGERVVTSGQAQLRNDAKVVIKSDASGSSGRR